ncbi:ExeA family protein [Rubrivivax albus]|uniref:Peptidoglycan-binding protein n=1 Tax=Rubrivivax albus TaxID=2499835 RepID=A0A437JYJ0_9BURK|nr:ExeA family protein [Rubrivivax albus]RVT52700.1 peptidoglycan-binding protein [Rubrivivax albus]
MYASFFGLHDEPFSVAPDPRFMYLSDAHREALKHLDIGLRGGGGFVLLTGEIGAGKTTVWRAFLETLPPDVDIATVVNPRLKVEALLARVCEDLGVARPEGAAEAAFDPIDALHGHLLLTHAQGRRTLIAVDEAQALSDDVLEQLRLLTNLVTSDRKLVQVLLIGQPELNDLLARPVMEPLAQRIVARYHLPALPEAETRRYIAHRLAVAGAGGPLPFDDDALALVHAMCRGIPRRINVLCDRAMLAAYEARQPRIGAGRVAGVASQVFVRQADPPAAADETAAPVADVAQPPAVPDVAEPALPPASPAPPHAPTRVWPWLLVAGIAGVIVAPWVRGLWAGPAPVVPTTATVPAPATTAAGPAVAERTVEAGATNQVPTAVSPARQVAPSALYARAWDEPAAWRHLATLWGWPAAGTEPCAAASAQGLLCHRGSGGLAVIRTLDRPVILSLADDVGRAAQVVLLGEQQGLARLASADGEVRVPMVELARHWRGDFATLWRVPPGYREGQLVTAAEPALADWLAQRLARLDGGVGGSLAERVAAFQRAQGLTADGLAGAMTLMQLNRASGVDEPRLAAAD